MESFAEENWNSTGQIYLPFSFAIPRRWQHISARPSASSSLRRT